MINIETIFKNHFDTERIGDNRLRAFSEDHINKLSGWLSVHTDADLSALLADLLTLHNAYFGAISDEEVKFSIQQGRTLAADNSWNSVLGFIRQKEGIVKGTWGKPSEQYEEFYPQGLEEYNQATKLNKVNLLARYQSAVNNHAIELGPAFVAAYNTLKSDWTAKFTLQQTQIGLVKDANSQTATVRDPLEVQLCRHILIIASKNVGLPEMVNDFFNQSLLQAPQFNLPKEGAINPGETKMAVDLETFDPDFELKVTNLSGGPLEFSLSVDGITPSGNSTTLGGPGSNTVPLSYFGINATFVMVHNQGAVVSQWKISRG